MTIDKSAPTDYPLIVDAHCHMGAFRNFHIPHEDIDGMVQTMDSLGIDVAIVAAHAGISSDYRMGNDQVIDAASRYPGRVLGYCCINPNYPGEISAELDRCFRDPIFRGVKLHPELHGDYPLDGPNYRPVFEFAAERGVPVLSHSYFGGDGLQVFARIADDYPTVPLLLGHAGLDFGIHHVVDVVRDHTNILLDLTGPLLWDGVLERLTAELGPERLVFGSDVPFVNPALQLGGCVLARLGHDDKEQILGRNAANLFRIDTLSVLGYAAVRESE